MQNEMTHVKFLRAALGPLAVPQPAINIGSAFAAAADAAAGACCGLLATAARACACAEPAAPAPASPSLLTCLVDPPPGTAPHVDSAAQAPPSARRSAPTPARSTSCTARTSLSRSA